MLLDRKDQVHWFNQECSVRPGSTHFFSCLILFSFSCLLSYLYYCIYISAERAHGIAYCNSHRTNHLTVMIQVPFIRSVNNMNPSIEALELDSQATVTCTSSCLTAQSSWLKRITVLNYSTDTGCCVSAPGKPQRSLCKSMIALLLNRAFQQQVNHQFP